MQTLPVDIQDKINSLFIVASEREEVSQLLLDLWKTSLNVGEEQLARGLLVLCDGKVAALREIIDSDFYGDPRDVLMRAERKLGNPGHYFINGFD